MARISGVNIPTAKRAIIALTYIHGIGRTSAQKICNTCGIPIERRVNELTDAELTKIRELIDVDYQVEGDLRREIGLNLKRLQATRSYRGFRHIRGLPVRGQRTSTNARTRKGPKKTVGVQRNPNAKSGIH